MLGFQNPVECKAAEQCLSEGNPLAAAQALLGSDQPAHREVRRLMLKTAPLLVREARRLFDAGEWDAAAMWIETAARCAALSPDDEALQRAIAARRDERQAEQSWRQQRLRRVDDLGREGRLVSALQHLEPLGDEPEVARRRLDLRDDVERLTRYAAEFQTYLGEQNWTAAEVVLAKARQLAPREPQVVAMDEQLKASRPPEAPPIAPPPFVPVPPRDDATDEEGKAQDESTSDWAVAREANSANSVNDANSAEQRSPTPAVRTTLLSGLSSYDDVLIIPRSTILVGTPKHLSVDLAILGALSSQHALLICEQSRKGPARWSVQPLHQAVVTVDGRVVEPGRSQRLENEQIVQFGQTTCRWLFRCPDDRHATAVLEIVRPSPSRALASGWRGVSTVVLGVGPIVIGRRRERCHLVHRDLPIEQLELAPSLDGWRVTAQDAGGTVFLGGEPLSSVPSRPMVAPFDIDVFDDSPNMMERMFQGGGGEFRTSLRLT